MAIRAASLVRSLTKQLQNITLTNCTKTLSCSNINKNNNFLSVNNVSLQNIRPSTSFFNKLPADQLWKGCTSVSNAGRKKGRGKGQGRKRIRDLNRGQYIGQGAVNMLWPGLNTPVMRGREIVTQRRLPDDPARLTNLYKLRDSMNNFRSLKLSPMERGWSGNKMPGRSIGPPDPVGEDKFEGFNSIVLEFKSLLLMKGQLGRTRKISSVVITGNGKGLAGFATGKGREGMAALRKAKNRAAQKLIHFDLYNNHSVFHDFFTQFGATKIFVYKKPEGYGLVGHRAIKAMCKVIGIKDLHAKVEGSMNLQHIVKAFFIGLLQQKTHHQLAEEKRLHLVEFRKENGGFPTVVASPSSPVRSQHEVPRDEVLDFTRYVMNNRVVLKKKKWPPFYTQMPHWQIYLKKLERRRNHELTRHNILAEHGALKSFLTDRFPEPDKEKTQEA